jgi:HSP20 family protein
MTNVPIQRTGDDQRDLPVFGELSRRLEAVREKAFERFMHRGASMGSDLDDWIAAEQEVLGWPAAELKEKNGTYVVDITLPGFTEKEVEVTATPSELIVHAATKHEATLEDAQVVWSEFRSNDVYRRFGFPTAVDTDKVSAHLERGMLKVVAPKRPATEAAAAPTKG